MHLSLQEREIEQLQSKLARIKEDFNYNLQVRSIRIHQQSTTLAWCAQVVVSRALPYH